MIRIKSFKEGFRRCGIAHSTEWREYEDDRFSDEELARLMADPMLHVVCTDADAGSKKAPAKANKDKPE